MNVQRRQCFQFVTKRALAMQSEASSPPSPLPLPSAAASANSPSFAPHSFLLFVLPAFIPLSNSHVLHLQQRHFKLANQSNFCRRVSTIQSPVRSLHLYYLNITLTSFSILLVTVLYYKHISIFSNFINLISYISLLYFGV